MIIHDVVQNTDEWYALRAGMPTASSFSKIVTSKGEISTQLKDYALTLAAEKYAGRRLDRWDGNQWTDRGHALEAVAASWWEFTYRSDDVKTVGFVTDDEVTYGCSPDRLLDQMGLLEIKCLKAENHIKTMMKYKRDKKPPSTHFAQCQGQMMITDRMWCHLLFYHDVLPPFVVVMERDDEYCKNLIAGIEKVIEERDRAYKIIQESAG